MIYCRCCCTPWLVPASVEEGEVSDFRLVTANILVNRRVRRGSLGRSVHTSFDFGNEFHAKAWPLAFVPCCRFDELRAGGTTKGNR
jgi:hypothetical protein